LRITAFRGPGRIEFEKVTVTSFGADPSTDPSGGLVLRRIA
jgi:hypothetical protein